MMEKLFGMFNSFIEAIGIFNINMMCDFVLYQEKESKELQKYIK